MVFAPPVKNPPEQVQPAAPLDAGAGVRYERPVDIPLHHDHDGVQRYALLDAHEVYLAVLAALLYLLVEQRAWLPCATQYLRLHPTDHLVTVLRQPSALQAALHLAAHLIVEAATEISPVCYLLYYVAVSFHCLKL